MLANLLNLQSILIGLVMGAVAYFWMKRRKYKLPPGPFPIPLLGNVSLFSSDQVFRDVYKLSDKYGPIVTMYVGSSPWIVLNNIECVLEAMVKKQADFASRPMSHSIDILTEGGKNIALAPYSDTWKYHRKIVGKALRHIMQGPNLDAMVNDSTSLVLERMAKEKGSFDPKTYMDLVICNFLYKVCLGKRCHFDDAELNRFIYLDEKFIDEFGNGLLEDIIPFLKDIWPTERYKSVMATFGEVMKIVQGHLEQHKKAFDESDIKDLMDSLLLARVEEEKEEHEENASKMTDNYIAQIVGDIMFAGIDTSRITLNWFVLHMAAYPDIQAKCHEVIDRVIGKNKHPTVSDKEDLSYIDACLHETMRVGTVLPMGLPHFTICDTSVGGYDIPKDTTVLINHWALHHDPKYWENVDKYDPQRYLDKDGKLASKPESWLPFSAGRRVCLGEPIAKVELLLICTRLLQRFVFKLPPGVTTTFKEKRYATSVQPAKYEVMVEDRMSP